MPWVATLVLPPSLARVDQEEGQAEEQVIEVTLTPDGDRTVLVIEERGVPLEQLAEYGAGWQIHVEDLGAHLAGSERREIKSRWEELIPYYRQLRTASRFFSGTTQN